MERSPSLTFALVLKRWFRANAWPQKITDDWAKDPGVNYPHGPWASQMCGAMKADGYNPRAEFFIALAVFNQAVSDQNFKSVQNQTLKSRLTGAKPLTLDDGRLFTPTDFWSLFAGQSDPPAEYDEEPAVFTQENADLWTGLMRDNFRKLSLRHMCNRAEAWQMLKAKLVEVSERENVAYAPDDFAFTQEVLAGFVEPEAEALIQLAQRYPSGPLVTAFAELLGDEGTKKTLPVA